MNLSRLLSFLSDQASSPHIKTEQSTAPIAAKREYTGAEPREQKGDLAVSPPLSPVSSAHRLPGLYLGRSGSA